MPNFREMPTIEAIRNMTREVRASWSEIESRIAAFRATNAASVLLERAHGPKNA